MMVKLRERQLLNALFMGRHGLIDNVYTASITAQYTQTDVCQLCKDVKMS